MNLFYPIKIAISNLLAAKVRSFLTIIGIIIGVASVILIVSVGNGAQQLIVGQIQSIGSNLVGVLPGKSDESGPPAQAFGIEVTTFVYDDFKEILNVNNVPEVVSGVAYLNGNEEIAYQSVSYNYSVNGVTHQLTEVLDTEVSSGRFFVSAEDTNLSRVAVIGSKVKEDLFGSANPINKKIKIGSEYFSVVGVLEQKGATSLGSSSQDETVFVPLFSAQKILFGKNYLSFARFKVRDEKEIETAKENIRKTLRIEHDIDRGEEEDFSVRDLASAVELISTVTSILTVFLAMIAAISLVVGGIGIMNIMLISINERIREIGLRKALGARRHHIISQFMIEAITITLTGGLLGIVVGILFSALIAVVVRVFGYDWQFIVSPISLFVGVVVSVSVGVIFGTYPAIKASRISPMEALRYE